MNQEEMIRDVRKRLFEMQDTGYRDFHARLVPTVVPLRGICKALKSIKYFL